MTVRPERAKTGVTPLPILVLVKTPTVGVVENSLNINVAAGWSVAASVTSSTAGLPSGVTPLPSISAGTGTGQNVLFNINDLVPGTSYGFYITDGLGLNPGAGNYTWVVSTNVDTRKVNVPVLNNDQVTITGRVGARASDFQIDIAADKTGTLSENEEITYTITYGTYLLNSVKPLVITGSWSRGTIQGSPSPTVDIVDFVVGSGSTGYGGVEPVVDTINRKVTWTINTFPANTINNTVSFKLKINNSYSGSSRVTFETKGELAGANVVTTDKTISNTYQPPVVIPTITPTPTVGTTSSTSSESSTNSGGATSTPTVTSTPTPTPTQKILRVAIAEIGTDRAVVEVGLGLVPTSLKMIYGKSLTGLNNSISSLNWVKNDRLVVDNLTKDSTYYFRIIADGVRSEIFTFTTAGDRPAANINLNSLQIAVNNIILRQNFILIPEINYGLSIQIQEDENIKEARVIVRNDRVLGVNSADGFDFNSVEAVLGKTDKEIYSVHLAAPPATGYYGIFIFFDDLNGNRVEKKVWELRVVPPLRVVDNRGRVVEGAAATMSRYDESRKLWTELSPELMGLANPQYSDSYGKYQIVLPPGRYRTEVTALGYQNQKVDFDIGMGGDEIYPEVVLERQRMGLLTFGRYLKNAGEGVTAKIDNLRQELNGSIRILNLVAIILLFLSGMITWIFVSDLIGVNWWQMPFSIFRNLWWLITSYKAGAVGGKVVDEKSGKPIRRAEVVLIDDKNKIISKKNTGFLGNFDFRLPEGDSFRLMALKKGYETTPLLDYSRRGLLAGEIVIRIENQISAAEKIQFELTEIIWSISKYLTTFFLIAVLWLLLDFGRQLGWEMVYPWIILAVMAVGMWVKLIY